MWLRRVLAKLGTKFGVGAHLSLFGNKSWSWGTFEPFWEQKFFNVPIRKTNHFMELLGSIGVHFGVVSQKG
jgi:hypothetical protein